MDRCCITGVFVVLVHAVFCLGLFWLWLGCNDVYVSWCHPELYWFIVECVMCFSYTWLQNSSVYILTFVCYLLLMLLSRLCYLVSHFYIVCFYPVKSVHFIPTPCVRVAVGVGEWVFRIQVLFLLCTHKLSHSHRLLM